MVNVIPEREPGKGAAATKNSKLPTIAVGATIAVSFALLTFNHQIIPTPIFILLLAVLTGWWSSFQHELVHGHLAATDRGNALIGNFTVDLWVPYLRYRSTHRQHHNDAILTDPRDDPESFYVAHRDWDSAGLIKRTIWRFNRTLFGRLSIGPLIGIVSFVSSEFRIVAGMADRDGVGSDNSISADVRRSWALHLLYCVPTLVWVLVVCKVPLWQYLIGASWLGYSTILLRSFAEHRWVPSGQTKSAVVLASKPWALLFLNNNLHHTHHASPQTPWFRLPEAARSLGSAEIASEGAGLYSGYFDVAKRYMFKPFDSPIHPTR